MSPDASPGPVGRSDSPLRYPSLLYPSVSRPQSHEYKGIRALRKWIFATYPGGDALFLSIIDVNRGVNSSRDRERHLATNRAPGVRSAICFPASSRRSAMALSMPHRSPTPPPLRSSTTPPHASATGEEVYSCISALFINEAPGKIIGRNCLSPRTLCALLEKYALRHRATYDFPPRRGVKLAPARIPIPDPIYHFAGQHFARERGHRPLFV